MIRYINVKILIRQINISMSYFWIYGKFLKIMSEAIYHFLICKNTFLILLIFFKKNYLNIIHLELIMKFCLSSEKEILQKFIDYLFFFCVTLYLNIWNYLISSY